MLPHIKVLISAYACLPEGGSEGGKGWACATALATSHNVWVVTDEQNRRAIEAALVDSPIANLNFVYVQLPSWLRAMQRSKDAVQISYYLWQIAAFLTVRRLHRGIDFDVVHHVTLSKYWMPSFLVFLPVPFIWGPVGGGESAPKPFWRAFSLRGKVYELLRNLARWLGERDPFVKVTARRSALVLATSEESRKRLEHLRPANLQTYPAIGLTRADIDDLNVRGPCETTSARFVSIGRLLHWKGFHLGLLAFAEAALLDAEYWLIGDGPELQRLKELSVDLRIIDRVRFLGRLPRADTLHKLCACDVLVHPSLHESGGWTCLEAMAAHKPVLCLNLGGPALQVSDAAGIRVTASEPAATIAELAAAMARLAGDAALRHRMGEAGAQRVFQYYTWDRKIDFYASLYRNFVRDKQDRVQS